MPVATGENNKKKGRVILVGAGPGDPGLMTVRGKAVLQNADVVVYDRLVGLDVLELAPGAKKIDVGKRQGYHPVPQDQINEILAREAADGMQVVRLKGGDPYLFGRGAEEAGFLSERGIPFEVVPGVTSALAALSHAGIPATHRDAASSVHIITGHAKADGRLQIDFDALRRTGGTLIFLMAVANMQAIANGLLAAGMGEDTPAAVIENGTLPRQRKVIGTLSSIHRKAAAAKIQSPAVLAVGAVCDPRRSLDWFTALPLFGRTIVVTRPKERAGTLTGRLQSLGANVVSFPCIETKPVNDMRMRDALQGLQRYHWLVLTSPQGAERLFACMDTLGMDSRALAPVKIAAIGSGTARELEKRGVRADCIPRQYDAVHLAQELVQRLNAGEKALLLRAEQGTPALPEILKRGNVAFDDIAVYATSYEARPDQEAGLLLEAGEADYVTFGSASAVKGFAACFPHSGGKTFTAVCIGAASEQAAQKQGYRTIKAKNATMEHLVQAILEEEGL